MATKLIALLLVATLSGCGTIDSIKNSQDTDYVTLSYSEAGGMYQWFTGNTSACKLSKHGVTGLKYTLTFKDGKCQVTALK